jgi:hypothetical protein
MAEHSLGPNGGWLYVLLLLKNQVYASFASNYVTTYAIIC